MLRLLCIGTCLAGALVLNRATQARAADGAAASFSSLPDSEKARLRKLVEPPPPAQRRGPYSAPQYYLFFKGYEYQGDLDKDPDKRTYREMKGKTGPDFGHWKLDRNRPDWQEAVLRDWAELGMNNTHLNVYPVDNKLELSSDLRQALEDYVRLSAKYGLKIGVRLDSLDETVLWTMHPNNPENRRKEYLDWVRQVASLLKGQTAYYVLGDELTLREPAATLPTNAWTPKQYLEYFKDVAGAIKSVDPSAKVSMFAASSGEWFNVLWLLKNGYREAGGDGVAINHYDYNVVPKLYAEAEKLAPGLLFLSNGVGYCSTATAQPRYPEWDPYSKAPTEEAHAAEIAKTMFSWWDIGASTAPYYISLRNWDVEGKVYPHWYGFFGFEDFAIKDDQLSVKRYPGWYAYQTVAHTFYNRDEFKRPTFGVTASEPGVTLHSYEHQLADGNAELLVMAWNDKAKQPAPARVQLDTSDYRFPIGVSLRDYHEWSDVPSRVEGGKTTLDLTVGQQPQIIRMFRTK